MQKFNEAELAARRERIKQYDAELATAEDKTEKRIKQLDFATRPEFKNDETERLKEAIRRINLRWHNVQENTHG